jgi:MinD superfamily P-loop ATPase
MRTVTVASGKGGTGKTTLSALLAHLASQTIRIVIADADVEASNLPLALRVDHAGCDSFAGGMKARIDPMLCTECGACVPVCRFGAVLVREGSHEIDTVGCEGCTACARICPTSAISMDRQQAGEFCTGLTEVGPIAYGQLHPGHDLSGKLVTEVRSRAVALGAVHGADLLLIDGPPGTGCPAIASVTGTDLVVAVTEPTKSGVHDLGRLEELVRRFGLPLVVVLNKADLSASGSREVRAVCSERNLKLLAEIPFDPALASVLQRMAGGSGGDGSDYDSRGIRIVREVWRELSQILDIPSHGLPVA